MTMEPSKLCDFCAKIDFFVYLLPTSSEVEKISAGANATLEDPYSFFGPECSPRGRPSHYNGHVETDLGTVERVMANEARCDLCEVLGEMLEVRAAEFELEWTPERKSLPCTIRTTYYLELKMADNSKWVVSRPTLLVWHHGKGSVEMRVEYCLQACDGGASHQMVSATFKDPRPDTDMMLFGGRIRPLEIDLTWIRRWIGICTAEHTACPVISDERWWSDPPLRLIDVQQMCIVQYTQGTGPLLPDYIALSYVWGPTSPEPVITSTNLEAMLLPGSIKMEQLSQTRRDTCYLAQLLNIRYVWMDVLCILQDSGEDKASQIMQMRRIYSVALFTVVAAGGPNADSGLPGLRPGTRTKKQKELLIPLPKLPSHEGQVKYLSLLTVLNPFLEAGAHHLDNTTWNTRAWTMQERLLAKRALVFTPEQMFWICNHTLFFEESFCEHTVPFDRLMRTAKEPTLSHGTSDQAGLREQHEAALNNLEFLIRDYSSRNLTFEGDIVNAFTGLQMALEERTAEKFVWGMPPSRFNTALGWRAYSGQRRRVPAQPNRTEYTIDDHIPSWSWMGWVGEASVNVSDSHIEGFVNELKIFVLVGVEHTDSEVLVDFRPLEQLNQDRHNRGTRAHDEHHDSFSHDDDIYDEDDQDNSQNDEEEYDHDYIVYSSDEEEERGKELGEESEEKEKEAEEEEEEETPESITPALLEQIPNLNLQQLAKFPYHSIICFWALSTTFFVNYDPPTDGRPSNRHRFRRGRSVFLPFGARIFDDAGGKEIGELDTLSRDPGDKTSEHRNGNYEFLLICHTDTGGWDLSEVDGEFIMMQIKRREDGVAERLSVGFLKASAWDKVGEMERKLVVMC